MGHVMLWFTCVTQVFFWQLLQKFSFLHCYYAPVCCSVIDIVLLLFQPWISLTYQPAGSNIATKYHDKMISNDGVPIDFTMSKCLHSLVFILSSKKCFNYSLHSLLIATFRKLKCSWWLYLLLPWAVTINSTSNEEFPVKALEDQQKSLCCIYYSLHSLLIAIF